ncbi:uncharacterized protein Bfra_007547 [Botrytis fragariae]|uniref:Uncharacterized protein n=1 Tax=Botrytis fragariae TaxID=1964551 RepID=A0A8H6EDK0_9HELO|nr:uncharacterized protein Bfra_007547 [Botrytis fragariae]KAF5868349.1 hypothetical protein Bfra_007547 [Botrytis fragariae]
MSEFPNKDAMPRPEQILETMKEADGNGLDGSKRSPGTMPEYAPAPPLTDAELEQYSYLFDFDAATMLDADWTGQVTENFDQCNAISSNPDLNASPFSTKEDYPIVTSSASANQPSSEQVIVDTPPIDIPGLENFGLRQEQQVDFLNTSDETIHQEINSWYANVGAAQANYDAFPEQNVEEKALEFTEEDQVVLDSFGPAIADEISAKYPTQDRLNMAVSQSSQAPTAQSVALQGSEQLSGTSDTNSLEVPTSSRVQPKDNFTTQSQLDSLVEWTEKKYQSSIWNFNKYDQTFLSAQTIPSPPMDHDEHIVSNYQESKSQSSIKIQELAPVMIVQRPEFRHNQAGAAQNRCEHNLLRSHEGYDEPNQISQMKSEGDWKYASLPHRYPNSSHGDLNAAQAPQLYSCLKAFGNNNINAGIELQRAGNDPTGIENRVGTTHNVQSQRNGNSQRGKASQVPKKRAGWETRPDATRPRVRMTEEEFQWLRPNEGPREVFETQRRKAAEERLKEEADAEALEKAGIPRPRPKQQKPFKGGIHIEVWEKDRLNDRRLAQGKSGRDLFSEKPKLRGKRKGRGTSETELPQPELKKSRLQERDNFENPPLTSSTTHGMPNISYTGNHFVNHNYTNNYTNNNYTSTMSGNGATYPAMINHGYVGSMSGAGGMNPGVIQSADANSMPRSGGQIPSIIPGNYHRAEQAGPADLFQARFNHNQRTGEFPSQMRSSTEARNIRIIVPPPRYNQQGDASGNLQPQLQSLQRPTAPIFGAGMSRNQPSKYPARSSMAHVSNDISSYLAEQNAQAFRSTGHVYPQDPL